MVCVPWDVTCPDSGLMTAGVGSSAPLALDGAKFTQRMDEWMEKEITVLSFLYIQAKGSR